MDLLLEFWKRPFNNLLCSNVCVNVGALHPNGEAVIGNWGSNNVISGNVILILTLFGYDVLKEDGNLKCYNLLTN